MPGRLPPWLKVKVSFDAKYRATMAVIREQNLHTVCQEAGCPNRGPCFASGTATFLILGDICTRSCRFCGVAKGKPAGLDSKEPERVAEAVRQLQLEYAVITSVTRDDLPDGGASAFAAMIAAIRNAAPKTKVEVLTPDFKGNQEALQMIAAARPDVFNHNLETVARLYPAVRPEADYRRSLQVLAGMKSLLPETFTKSGLMVGLGETRNEVLQSLRDLRSVACDLLTIGQYLAPSPQHYPVAEFILPEVFKEHEQIALKMGFRGVAAGPLVRSSYRAGELFGK
jgi:lipoic acid synthetase